RTNCTASVSRRKRRLKFTSSIIVAVAKKHNEHKRSVKFYLVTLLLLFPASARAQTSKVSVLDFGSQPIAQRAAEAVRERLRASGAVQVADADLSRAAAKGIGYSGSLNLTVNEARDLGAVLAAEFYIIGDAQTLRRSSFEKPLYFESYCSIFLVSTRTGKLLFWDRPSFENNEATRAESSLSQYIADNAFTQRLIAAIGKAQADERIQRTVVTP